MKLQTKWLVLFILIMSPGPTSGYVSECNDLQQNLELDPESWFNNFKNSLSVDQYKLMRRYFLDEAQLDLKQAQILCNTTLSHPVPPLLTTALEEIKGNFVASFGNPTLN